jgi:DNA-binding transcriptional LysR family regulator
MNRTHSALVIPDLNALFYFSKVVEYGGFSAAQREIGIPKSRLSRRMAELEKELGVRLLQRNTRRLALTEIGKLFHEHCRAMTLEAEGAIGAVLKVKDSPRGIVRVSCPVTASQVLLTPVLPGFLQRCPEVTLRVQVTNRIVDLFEDDVDLALRVRSFVDDTAGLIVQGFWTNPQRLLAAKSLLKQHRPANLQDLRKLPTLDLSPRDGRHVWHLKDPDGRTHEYFHQPRVITDDMQSLRQAALAGYGAVALPEVVCAADLRSGSLAEVLPGWTLPKHQLYAAFLSRRGLMPAVKNFLDYLSESFSERGLSSHRRNRVARK